MNEKVFYYIHKNSFIILTHSVCVQRTFAMIVQLIGSVENRSKIGRASVWFKLVAQPLYVGVSRVTIVVK